MVGRKAGAEEIGYLGDSFVFVFVRFRCCCEMKRAASGRSSYVESVGCSRDWRLLCVRPLASGESENQTPVEVASRGPGDP